MCFNTLCLDPGRVPMILQHMAIERLERGNWVELDFWYLAAWVGATCRYHVCYIHKRCYFFLQFHVIGQCECRVPSLSSLPVSLHRSLFGRCSSESTRVGQGAHELWLTWLTNILWFMNNVLNHTTLKFKRLAHVKTWTCRNHVDL